MLTQKYLKEILSYDEETGIFSWIRKKNGVKQSPAGTRENVGRRKIGIDRKQYFAHRLAWLYVYGEWPKLEIDHIDGNNDNNAIKNLRDVSRSVNMQNLKRSKKNNGCGVLGISFRDNKKWVAQIGVNKKVIHIGRFDTKDEAKAAYLAAKRIFHKEGYVPD